MSTWPKRTHRSLKDRAVRSTARALDYFALKLTWWGFCSWNEGDKVRAQRPIWQQRPWVQPQHPQFTCWVQCNHSKLQTQFSIFTSLKLYGAQYLGAQSLGVGKCTHYFISIFGHHSLFTPDSLRLWTLSLPHPAPTEGFPHPLAPSHSKPLFLQCTAVFFSFIQLSIYHLFLIISTS